MDKGEDYCSYCGEHMLPFITVTVVAKRNMITKKDVTKGKGGAKRELN